MDSFLLKKALFELLWRNLCDLSTETGIVSNNLNIAFAGIICCVSIQLWNSLKPGKRPLYSNKPDACCPLLLKFIAHGIDSFTKLEGDNGYDNFG